MPNKTSQKPPQIGLLTLPAYIRDRITTLTEIQSKHGDIVQLNFGPYTLYHISDPNLAQQILKSPNYTMSATLDHPFFGNGLASNADNTWMQQRRLMQPAFGPRHHPALFAPIIQEISKQLQQWSAASTIDVMPGIYYAYHKMLGQIILGLNFDDYPDQYQNLVTIRHYITTQYQKILPIPENWPTPRNQRFQKAVASFNAFVDKQVAQAKQKPSSENIIGLLAQASDPKTGYSMADIQLRSELNSILFNGYDDPVNGVAWALYLLAQHPNIVQKLRKELIQNLGTTSPSIDPLMKLPYLGYVIDEALRLYPPAWSLLRDTVENDCLQEYTINTPSMVLINIYLIHRHPNHWIEPAQFKPERFADTYPSVAYLPFGSGPRRCIGQHLSMLIMKTMLTMILQTFDISSIPNKSVKLDAKNSLGPQKSLFLNLRPLKN